MAETIRMKFNGREIEAEKGKPLIDLSRELGDEIPHFCYHPGIGADGNCRLCLVELEGAPKLVTACTLAAGEGMEVRTNTEKVAKARAGVLEFLLLNHPLDCPICDKGGECPLQDYTRLHGPAHSRMADEKNAGRKHLVIGEYIIYDSERCITCTRCLRFMRDVVGREELLVRNRGDRSIIALFQDGQLTSGFTGNLADLCPVGALTTRQYRFQARPWELEKVSTICGECSLHCSASSWWKKDEILRLTPDLEPRVNAWWLCDKGRFSYVEAPAENRNLVRRQGEFVPVSAREARERAAELLAEAGPRAAVLAGSQATNEELAAVAELQKSLRPELSPFTDVSREKAFLEAAAQAGIELEDLSDLSRFDRVLVLGLDPELSHPLFGLRLAAPGGPKVTLVQNGPWAGPSRFTRDWERVDACVLPWWAAHQDYLEDDDALLLAVTGKALREGAFDADMVAKLAARKGHTRLLVLLEGFNRRGLIAISGGGESVLAALERGEIDTLLLFGIDPELDMGFGDEWRETLGHAGRILLQSRGMMKLAESAEVQISRRSPKDLKGTVINTFGLERTLDTWAPVAGVRPLDLDWLADLKMARPEEVAP